jgi:predicted ATPase
MQLERLDVEGLFGRFEHSIPLPTQPEDDEQPRPSIAILHGPNGVGKTTVLRMLSGFLRLDFSAFRRVPCTSATLTFSTSQQLTVRREQDPPHALEVRFGDMMVRLHADRSGPLLDEDAALVEHFRSTFFKATEGITFDFVDTGRMPLQVPPEPGYAVGAQLDDPRYVVEIDSAGRARRRRRGPRDGETPLAERVARFIADAQVDYRRFFSTSEPDLFPRIMQRLTSTELPAYDAERLLKTLTDLRDQALRTAEVGLEVEPWDYEQLVGHLRSLSGEPAEQYALTVLGTFTEFLASRVEQRELVAHRLRAFEALLDDFFLGKHVKVHPRDGLHITSDAGEPLRETQLSSGEFHLLYLMVTSLVTRRRGTVIAIDEPEISMHIAWQRKLISSLVACASNASPQFIFATHSPDIVADYRDQMIPMTPDGS